MIQSHISQSLAGLDENLILKYNLIKYTNPITTAIFFGMYRDEDYVLMCNHIGQKSIIWFGSDALDLNPEWINEVNNCVNIGVSHQVVDTLQCYGVDAVWYPVNAVMPHMWPNKPNGDKLFWYSGNAPEFYGESLINEIKERINLTIIRAGHDTFTRDQLVDVYSQCFLNLRLTAHDGSPNTNIEMGLMGRRSIYNGELPASIPWQGVDDICQSIMREYHCRHVENKYISEIYHNFVNYERVSSLFV